MNSITHWYYLHTNGSLICKKDLDDGMVADFRESDFVRHFWPCDVQNREMAWNTVVEATALGADPVRVAELAQKWNCDDDDAQHYAEAIGCMLYRDGNQWCATRLDFVNLQESPAGFGTAAYEALAELAKALGFKPSKMWGHTFRSLLAAPQIGGEHGA